MTVELTTDDQAAAEALVSSGRFSSIQDAVQAGLQTLAFERDTISWSSDLQQAVDAGAQAAARDDFASDADVDTLFGRYQQR